MTLNIAALAPMPRPSVRTTAAANPGDATKAAQRVARVLQQMVAEPDERCRACVRRVREGGERR